jgi:hypothetical protein
MQWKQQKVIENLQSITSITATKLSFTHPMGLNMLGRGCEFEESTDNIFSLFYLSTRLPFYHQDITYGPLSKIRVSLHSLGTSWKFHGQ